MVRFNLYKNDSFFVLRFGLFIFYLLLITKKRLLLKFGRGRRSELTNEYPATQWPRCPTKLCIVSVTS